MLQKIVCSGKPLTISKQQVRYSSDYILEKKKAHSTAVKIAAREKYITEDDITNLRIELELCTDSQQFIDSI